MCACVKDSERLLWHQINVLTDTFAVLDILPDPPDGTPVIESITGKTITLSWKKPRRLDPSIGIIVHVFMYISFNLETVLVL